MRGVISTSEDRPLLDALGRRSDATRTTAEAFERAAEHRIDRVLAAAVVGSGADAEIEARCRHILRTAAVEELARQAALTPLLTSLAARRTAVVLIKGDA